MNMKQYQTEAAKTAIYPGKGEVRIGANGGLYYTVLGLLGEAGEVAQRVKKQIRDHDADMLDGGFLVEMQSELGDCLWYLSQIAKELDMDLEIIAINNLNKLKLRMERGKLQGSGDDR